MTKRHDPDPWDPRRRKYGVHSKLISLEERFFQLSKPPIIANYVDVSTEEGTKRLNQMLYTQFEGETTSVVPMCVCKSLKGGWNRGLTCGLCNTVCQNSTEREMESTIWLKVPENVRAFMNPVA